MSSGGGRKKSKRSGLTLVLTMLLLASCGWLVLHYRAAFEATKSSSSPASSIETSSFSSLVGRTRDTDAVQSHSPRMQLYSVAAQQNETIALLRREIGDLLSKRRSSSASSGSSSSRSSSSGQSLEAGSAPHFALKHRPQGPSSVQSPLLPPPLSASSSVAAPATPVAVKAVEEEASSDSQLREEERTASSSSSPFANAIATLRGNAMLNPFSSTSSASSSSLSGRSPDLPHSPTLSTSSISSSSVSSSSTGSYRRGGSQGHEGGGVFAPTRIAPNEWLVYLRIQKTGSQTFWSTLQKEFRPDTWRSGGGGSGSGQCPDRNFCGGKGNKGNTCEDVVYKDAKDILRQQGSSSRGGSSGGACKFLFRGHINVFDYREGLKAALVPLHTVKFITFLREPIARALSEFSHVTEGLVAQFGPETFGAAWDYAFYWNKSMPLAEKRSKATLKAWLQCQKCRVGSSNRQARFLAGLATTGVLTPAEEEEEEGGGVMPQKGEKEGGKGAERVRKGSDSSSVPGLGASSSSSHESGSALRADVQLLSAAVAVLKECAFVGLMERFEDSMLLLKLTFPMELKRFKSYMTSPHPVSEAQLEKKRKASAAAAANTIVPPRHHYHHQQPTKQVEETKGRRRNVLASDAVPVLRKAGSGWGHDKEEVKEGGKEEEEEEEETESALTSSGGGEVRLAEVKNNAETRKEIGQAAITTDAAASKDHEEEGEEIVSGIDKKLKRSSEEENAEARGDEEGGRSNQNEDLQLLVELNKADLGLYAVAERLFEARFAAATGFSSTDQHKAGERLGERFQFKKDVTLTRKRNRKFTAKLYELERAVYLGDRENDD